MVGNEKVKGDEILKNVRSVNDLLNITGYSKDDLFEFFQKFEEGDN